MRVARNRQATWHVLAVAVALLIALPASTASAVAEQPPQPTADGAGAAKFRPVVDAAVAELATQLGVSPLSTPPFIQLLKTKLAGGGQYAHTWYYDGGACLIQLQPAGQKLDPVDTKFVLTHEVVHCYQGRETGGADVTDWVEEGAATWAAAKIAPGSKIAQDKWGPYLALPPKSLYARAYDGVGFFGHLEHVGVDVWPRILKMMTADSDDAAFAIATADNATALDHWPTGLARDASLGGAWDTDGPDIPGTKPPRLTKTIGNGTGALVSIAKAANAIVNVNVKADVFTVDASSGTHGRLRDSAGTDRLVAEVAGRPLCAMAGGCVCPDGTPAAGITLDAITPGAALLGATGGTAATKVALTGRSLEEFCAKPAKVDPCIVGRWIGQGVTINLPSIEIVGKGGQGAVLTFEKTGVGSVDLDPSAAVQATLPGDLVGTFRLRGQTAGVVNASKGVMTTLAATTSNATIEIVVEPLGAQTVPLAGGGVPNQPFDGLYTCTKTTLVYTAPGFGGESTWTRA